ncbi:MAG: ABC transporter permease [Alphaproteobacteria bacterium]|nr:ABC transporter permease [Alphaproteobacteria bacterium]
MAERRRLLRNWRVLLGGGLLLALAIAAVFAPVLAPYDPLDQDLAAQLVPPDWQFFNAAAHALGTDSLGRDVLSRLIWGSRVALTVALVAGALTALAGTALGLAAGFFGGWLDALISRLVDVWSSFPPVLLSIILVALIGTGLWSVVVAIVVIDWTRFCRVVRAETLKQRGMDYVDAAVVAGLAPRAILWREVVPNVLPLVLVLLTLEMGIAVVVEAILSFVGLSISSDAPSWGGMIAEGRTIVHEAPWVLVGAMAVLLATVLGFNLLGDGLKAELDPVLR